MTTQRATSFIRFDPTTRVNLSAKHTAESGEPTWIVSGGLSYYIGPRKEENWVYVPNGYRVTGADVLRPFKDWIKPCDEHGQAVIIHNYLCSTAKVRMDGERQVLTRKTANKVFLEAMTVLGVPWIKRKILYWAACAKSNEDQPPATASLETTRMDLLG